MKRVEEYLNIRYDKHKKKWDSVIAICGAEGGSKSNLALHIIDWWYTKLNGKCKATDIKHMCLDEKQFERDLSDCIKMEATVFDEAGALSSRAALTKFNKKLMKAYQVIRADLLFTILVIPDIWDLDTWFRNKRIKGLFYVYQRGRVAFFGKEKTRLLMMLNQNRIVKSYTIVKPTFRDTFPIYKGVLAEPYQKLKDRKVLQARRELRSEDIENENSLKEFRMGVIIKLNELDFNYTKIGTIVGLCKDHVGILLRKKGKNRK